MESYLIKKEYKEKQLIVANKGFGYGLIDFEGSTILPFYYDMIVVLEDIVITHRLIDNFYMLFSLDGKYRNIIYGDSIIFGGSIHYSNEYSRIAIVIDNNKDLLKKPQYIIISPNGETYEVDMEKCQLYRECIIETIPFLNCYLVHTIGIVSLYSGVLIYGIQRIMVKGSSRYAKTKPIFCPSEDFPSIDTTLIENLNSSKEELVDIQNKTVIATDFNKISYFIKDKYAVVIVKETMNGSVYNRKEEKYGIINNELQVVLPVEYDKIEIYNLKQMLIVARKNELTSILNEQLNAIFPTGKMSVTVFNIANRPIVEVKKKDEVIIMNEELDIIFSSKNISLIINGFSKIYPSTFTDSAKNSDWSYCHEYNNDKYFVIKKDDKYGLMNTDFEIVLPIEYNDIWPIDKRDYSSRDFQVRKSLKLYTYSEEKLVYEKEYKINYLDDKYSNNTLLEEDINNNNLFK